jgi:hypothetical protein
VGQPGFQVGHQHPVTGLLGPSIHLRRGGTGGAGGTLGRAERGVERVVGACGPTFGVSM